VKSWKFLTLFALFAALSVAGLAQQNLGEPTEAVRARLFELLSSDCGAAKEVLNFNHAVADLAVGITPLLLDVLKDGVPETIRKTVQAEASARYDRRQAWLAEDGEALFGEDARRLSTRKRTDHVADVLRRTDILFRENAVRALGIVGGPDAVAAISSAVEREPDLARLADIAVKSIESRSGN